MNKVGTTSVGKNTKKFKSTSNEEKGHGQSQKKKHAMFYLDLDKICYS